jgi:hypothetical protein
MTRPTVIRPLSADAVALSTAREQLARAELVLRAAGVEAAHAAVRDALAAVDMGLAVALGRLTPAALRRQAERWAA